MSQTDAEKILEFRFYDSIISFSANGFDKDYYIVTPKANDEKKFLLIHVVSKDGKKSAKTTERDYSDFGIYRFVSFYEIILTFPENIYYRFTGEDIKISEIRIKDFRTYWVKHNHLLDYQMRLYVLRFAQDCIGSSR